MPTSYLLLQTGLCLHTGTERLRSHLKALVGRNTFCVCVVRIEFCQADMLGGVGVILGCTLKLVETMSSLKDFDAKGNFDELGSKRDSIRDHSLKLPRFQTM